MNVSSKITQKLAALLILTAGVYLSSEFAGSAFVRAGSERSHSAAVVGKQAPTFSLAATNGKIGTLSKRQGQFVLPQWLNCDFQFVNKHYASGKRPASQKELPCKEQHSIP